MSEILTRQEAAEFLRISVRQLDRLKLPRFYIGRLSRYSKATLHAFIDEQTVTPHPNGNLSKSNASVIKSHRQDDGKSWLRSRLDELK